MRIKITQEFFLEVDPDWYNFLLDNEGSIEDNILKYEQGEVEEGIIAWSSLEKGKAKLEIVKPETTKPKSG